MTMMMAIPAMPMWVSNLDNNLGVSCWNQRHQEHEGEKSKH
jgi:hypothetical protein